MFYQFVNQLADTVAEQVMYDIKFIF
ncbi:Protein of unknown function [Bacillus wiedmannii]|nr:Protein of unknown function [Bacillus wiedmannii]